MAHAYTPGLKVTAKTLVRKKRILPLKGEVVVSVGDQVDPDTVVARTDLPGEVGVVNVANLLGVTPEEVPECMLKKESDAVEEGEVIAVSKSFFGLFKSEAKSPMSGTIESISSVTGQVLIRGPAVPVEVKAYLRGKVVAIYENEGVGVETWAAFVQGIFGIGGETHGEIKVVVNSPDEVVTADHIDDSCKGKVVVGGSLATVDSVRKAIDVGACGFVTGGFHGREIEKILGYDIGVAITGHEDIGITLILTEGFGKISMAKRTFDLLKSHEGQLACVNGATQIRAGVIRPEVVIPLAMPSPSNHVDEGTKFSQGLEVGSPVRVIREPYFGRLGTVVELPPEPHVLDSGSKARVLKVKFWDDNSEAIIPRANVELIEE